MTNTNPTPTTIIKRDGIEVDRVAGDPMAWFHRNVSSSMEWALKYEGYSIETVQPTRTAPRWAVLPVNLTAVLSIHHTEAEARQASADYDRAPLSVTFIYELSDGELSRMTGETDIVRHCSTHGDIPAIRDSRGSLLCQVCGDRTAAV